MTTIYETTYRDGQGAGDLLDYMEREDSPLRDRTGSRMTDGQREKFVEKSEKHQFERDIIISPENGEDMDRRDMGRATRQTMSEFVEDRPTSTGGSGRGSGAGGAEAVRTDREGR